MTDRALPADSTAGAVPDRGPHAVEARTTIETTSRTVFIDPQQVALRREDKTTSRTLAHPGSGTSSRARLHRLLRCSAVAVAAVAASAWLASCTLIDAVGSPARRALRVQGGALTSFCRESRLETYAGLPGVWRWRIAYRADHRFGISMVTDVGEQSYLTDGTTVRGYTDGALLVTEPLEDSALQTLLRWTAATTLSALAAHPSELEVYESSLTGNDARADSRIEVRFADADARYALTLDRRGRLIEASGPIDAPPVGTGRLRAEFSDFRTVEGRTLPFHIAYDLNGKPLLDEHVLSFVPHAPWQANESPTRVPPCTTNAHGG